MSDSKIPTSSFASRFRFGASKNKSTADTPSNSALHEINRSQNNGATNAIAVSINNGTGSDRSESPAATLTSNTSASPKENKQGTKSMKGGIFGNSATKKKQKKVKEKEKEEPPKVENKDNKAAVPAQQNHGFRFKLFGNFGKHNVPPTSTPLQKQLNSADVTSTPKPNDIAPEIINKNQPQHHQQTVVDSATITNAMQLSLQSSVSPRSGGTENGSAMSSLLVTAASTTALTTSTTSGVSRPTYLPAMVSADTFNGVMSPSVLSGINMPVPMSPPDSNNSSLPPQPPSMVVVTTAMSSYNHRSTAALPATNPYVKPRAPSSSRPGSPAASPTVCINPSDSLMKPQPTPPQPNEESAGFIFRPRLSRPPLSQQPAAAATAANTITALSHHQHHVAATASSATRRSPSNNLLFTSLSGIPNFAVSSSMNGGAELLTPSSVESLETRLIAKSMVAPSPPIPRKYPQNTPPTVTISNNNQKITPAQLLPRVAPLAKVDSLDTNLSASGFCTPAIEHPPALLMNRAHQLGEPTELTSAEKGAHLIDFARFLQHLSDEQGMTSTCMRQSYSLDLRQIPVSTSTHNMLANNNHAPPPQPSSLTRPSEQSSSFCSPALETVTPESCMYCHHHRGLDANNKSQQSDSTSAMRTSTTEKSDMAVPSTITDYTFTELTGGEGSKDIASDDFPEGSPNGTNGVVTSSAVKRHPPQSASSGNNNNNNHKGSNSKQTPNLSSRPQSFVMVTNNNGGQPPVVDPGEINAQRQYLEGLSHDIASMKVYLENLYGHMVVPETSAQDTMVEPVPVADVATETEVEPEPEKTDTITELRQQMSELEKELANRAQIIETLQKLLVEQKMLLETKQNPPAVECSTTSTNTEISEVKCESTQTDVDKTSSSNSTTSNSSNELTVSTNGHVGAVHIASPNVIRANKVPTIISKSSTATGAAHVAKVHVVVAKSSMPVAALHVGEAPSPTPTSPIMGTHQNIASPTVTAVPVVVKTSQTGILRPQTSTSSVSGMVKPTPIFRRPATTSATSLTHVVVNSGNSTAVDASPQAMPAPSRLPRLAASAIPAPMIATGSGR